MVQPHLSLALTLALVLITPAAQAQWSEQTLVAGLPYQSISQLRCGDIDGDGDADVVSARGPLSTISWFESTGDSSPSVEHLVSTAVIGVQYAVPCDLDGDGDLDLMVGGLDHLCWFENDGQGGFAVEHPVPQPFVTGPRSGLFAELADLDRDGDPDLVLTTTDNFGGYDRSLHWYENAGGVFTRVQTFAGSQNLGRTVTGDFDGDGDLDMHIPFIDFPNSGWYRNEPAAGGGIQMTYTGSMPASRWPLPTDFDGDGDLDVLLVTGDHVRWSENLGTEQFGPSTVLIPRHPVPGNTFIYQGEVTDLDGDGDDDLVLSIRPTNTTSDGTRNRIAWYENLGNRTLGPRQDLVPIPFYEAFIGFGLGDFDGDADIDVIGTHRIASSTADLVWYRNERELGSLTCSGAANSSGVPGGLRITGSLAVEANRLVLSAFDLPHDAYGYFLVSPTSVPPAMPAGSQGLLCLGGAIGRFVAPGQIQSSGSAGAFALSLDLTGVPTPTGPLPVSPGETRHFQCWHRDVVGGTGTSNLTSAVGVTLR